MLRDRLTAAEEPFVYSCRTNILRFCIELYFVMDDMFQNGTSKPETDTVVITEHVGPCGTCSHCQELSLTEVSQITDLKCVINTYKSDSSATAFTWLRRTESFYCVFSNLCQKVSVMAHFAFFWCQCCTTTLVNHKRAWAPPWPKEVAHTRSWATWHSSVKTKENTKYITTSLHTERKWGKEKTSSCKCTCKVGFLHYLCVQDVTHFKHSVTINIFKTFWNIQPG